MSEPFFWSPGGDVYPRPLNPHPEHSMSACCRDAARFERAGGGEWFTCPDCGSEWTLIAVSERSGETTLEPARNFDYVQTPEDYLRHRGWSEVGFRVGTRTRRRVWRREEPQEESGLDTDQALLKQMVEDVEARGEADGWMEFAWWVARAPGKR